MSEILFILIILLCITTIFCMYNFLNKEGLYFVLINLIVLINILSHKIINIFDFNLDISIIPHTFIFVIIYILLKKYALKEKNKIFKMSLYTSLLSLVLLIISNLYIQLVEDNMSMNLYTMFFNNFKSLLIVPLTLLGEQILYFDIYEKLDKKYDSIFITNVIACIILGILSSFIISGLTYINILTYKQLIDLILTNYLFKIFIILINLPLITKVTKKVRR